MDPQNRQQNVQKWLNISVLAMLMFICLGFCSSNKSLYLAAITDALDIKRSVFSLATSCRFVVTAIINIFFGQFVAKFGTKKLILVGIVTLMASVFFNSIANSMPLFFLAEILSGIGFSWAGTTIVGCVVGNWFDENRGTVTGAVLCCNGLGGALAAQIVSPLINAEGNPFGYRNAYRLIFVILAVLFVVAAILFRDKTATEGKAPAKKKKKGRSWVGISYSEALRKPYFYGAAICIFITGMVLHGVNGISAAHMKDVGVDAAFVATVLSISSLCLTGSKFMAGFLYDKLGLRATMTICSTAAMLTMVTLALVSDSLTGRTVAIIYAVCSAVALPLETVMLPLYAGDLFGDKDYNKVVGIFVSFNTAGYALGSPVANLGYDIAGNYTGMLILFSILMLAVVVALQFVIVAAHKIQKKVLAEAETAEIAASETEAVK